MNGKRHEGRGRERSMTRRKVLIILLQIAIVLVVVSAFGTVGFLEYSAQPGFCNNCHNMEPYYESWLTSSHNEVRCIECHYPPGIRAEAMGKVQAANQVVKYLTRTYSEKPWAEIEDAACTREGCHLQQELGVVSFMGVRFDHQAHLGELRRGKQLRCTSCHSQIVQGEHLTVTQSTCSLCHFKDQPPGQPLGGCLSCHPQPPNVEYQGVPIDHHQIVRDLVSCVKCHADVAVGDGAAEEERCWSCHNLPERIDEFENTTYLHLTHIAENNIECQLCHTTIQHKVVALEESFELECSNCHAGAHRAQQAVFAGSGGHEVQDTPSRMYLARVSCESCHALPGQIPGHAGVTVAGEATCLSCHGVRYAGLLPQWQEAVDQRLRRVTPVVVQARRLVGPAPGVAADSLMRAAEANLELVRVGRGAHNMPYADQLLRAALGLAQRAVEEAGSPGRLPAVDLGPPLSEESCLSCHAGMEETAPVTWNGRSFPHSRHVSDGLRCETCHTPASDHGGLLFADVDSCDQCHHSAATPDGCSDCHGGAPSGSFPVETGRFIHEPHVGGSITCGQCHVPPFMDASGTDCTTCHMIHHTPSTDCTACHEPSVGAIHPPAVHQSGCQPCHGEAVPLLTSWSRDVCLVCHQDRVEHNSPLDCVQCHDIPAMGGGGD